MDKRVILLNGAPNCVDGETEFFTGIGWKSIKDYKIGDSVLEYNKSNTIATLSQADYVKIPMSEGEEFLGYKCPILDMLMTSEHKVLYETSRGNLNDRAWGEIFTRLQDNLQGFSGKILTTFKRPSDGVTLSDAELKFIVALSADSSKIHSSKRKYCFNLKKPRKIERLRGILGELNYKYSESVFKSMEGYVRFIVDSPFEKGLPDSFYDLNEEQNTLVSKELRLWDGSAQTFYTNVEREADIAQMVFTKDGCRSNKVTTLRDREGRKLAIEYRVTVTTRQTVTMSGVSAKSHTYTAPPKDGFKYCFTTETGYWVARRNGKIFITGNCGKDTLGGLLQTRLGGTMQQFKEQLYVATAEHFKLPLNSFVKVATDRVLKEVESPYLNLPPEEYIKLKEYLGKDFSIDLRRYEAQSITPREAMIYLSELVVKPTLGEAYFGIKAAENMCEGNNWVTDSGFKQEAVIQVNEFGAENVFLVKIHREGCSFEGDSRSYISLDEYGVATLELDNNHTLEDAVRTIADWLYVNIPPASV